MKKVIGLCMVLVSLVLCSQTVRADVIWEPQNSFYEKHSNKCEYVDREFMANGPNGEVIVYKSPENAAEIGTMKNGETTWVTWTYTDADGTVWGYPNRVADGWVPMDYMQVVYDYISFEEEHGNEFVEESGFVDEFYMKRSIYLWNYPGSTVFAEIDMTGDWADRLPEYNKTYVDEAGRKWGFCGYYYGQRNFWVCLDDADADYEALYGEDVPETSEPEFNMPPVEDAEPIVPKERFPIEIIGISVGVVGILTGVILIKMKKKSRVQ